MEGDLFEAIAVDVEPGGEEIGSIHTTSRYAGKIDWSRAALDSAQAPAPPAQQASR